MCELNDDVEIREFVLRALLEEVLKDGKIDPEEKEAVHALGPVLNIPPQRAVVIRNEVLKSLRGVESSESVSYVQLFQTVRKKLLEKYPPDSTDNYLEMLAKKINHEAEFMDALAFGF